MAEPKPIKGPVSVTSSYAQEMPYVWPENNEAVLVRRLTDAEQRIAELEGDLVRVVELIVKGDIESSKFKEILTRRQGPAK